MRKINKKLSIILVDDDSDDRMLFAKALDTILSDYEFLSFSNGMDAIDHFKKLSEHDKLPDLLFLDINMPIIDGLETLEILRGQQKLQWLPIAMYSTSSREEDIHTALVSGANIYINKPSSFDKLTEALRKVLQANIHNDGELRLDTFLLSV